MPEIKTRTYSKLLFCKHNLCKKKSNNISANKWIDFLTLDWNNNNINFWMPKWQHEGHEVCFSTVRCHFNLEIFIETFPIFEIDVAKFSFFLSFLFIYLFIYYYLYIYYLFIYLIIYLFIHLSFIYLFIHSFIYLFVSFFISFFPSFSLSFFIHSFASPKYM